MFLVGKNVEGAFAALAPHKVMPVYVILTATARQKLLRERASNLRFYLILPSFCAVAKFGFLY